LVKRFVAALTTLVSGRDEPLVGAEHGTGPKVPVETVIAAVRRDYEERQYFLSGDISKDVYLPSAQFVDPTVTVNGLSNWSRNIKAINRFVADDSLELLDISLDGSVIRTRWHLTCTITLPWRPTVDVLGRTDHYLEESSGRIFRHVERWDISATDALLQLIRPGRQQRQR